MLYWILSIVWSDVTMKLGGSYPNSFSCLNLAISGFESPIYMYFIGVENPPNAGRAFGVDSPQQEDIFKLTAMGFANSTHSRQFKDFPNMETRFSPVGTICL